MTNVDNIYYVDEQAFDNLNNQEVLYWFGLLLADGCITIKEGKDNKTYYTLSLTLTDLEHVEKFKLFLKTDKDINYTDSRKLFFKKANKHYICKPIAHLNISNEILCKRLVDLGMIQKKSLILKFPEFLKDHPLVNHFIRGFFDGDGCISDKKKKLTSALHFTIGGTLDMMQNIMDIFYKKLNIKKRKIYSSKICQFFCLHVTRKIDVKKVKEFLYKDATIFLERKKQIFDNHSEDKFKNCNTSQKRGICLRKNSIRIYKKPWRTTFYNSNNWKRHEKSFKTEREAILFFENLPKEYCVHKPHPNEL